MKLGVPRWYVDADTLGLAHVLIRARPDVTFPGDDGRRHKERWTLPPCIITRQDTLDPDWIPRVAAQGWGIITRDKRISEKTLEKEIVRAYGARMFAITDPRQLTVWQQLDVVVRRWPDMEGRLDNEAAPFIYSISRTTMTALRL